MDPHIKKLFPTKCPQHSKNFLLYISKRLLTYHLSILYNIFLKRDTMEKAKLSDLPWLSSWVNSKSWEEQTELSSDTYVIPMSCNWFKNLNRSVNKFCFAMRFRSFHNSCSLLIEVEVINWKFKNDLSTVLAIWQYNL